MGSFFMSHVGLSPTTLGHPCAEGYILSFPVAARWVEVFHKATLLYG